MIVTIIIVLTLCLIVVAVLIMGVVVPPYPVYGITYQLNKRIDSERVSYRLTWSSYSSASTFNITLQPASGEEGSIVKKGYKTMWYDTPALPINSKFFVTITANDLLGRVSGPSTNVMFT